MTRRFDASIAVRVGYVAVVCGLAGYATADVDDIKVGAFAAALVLCLPVAVPGLPFMYVALGLGWAVTDADSGGPTCAMTILYVVVLGGLAFVNALLLKDVWNWLRDKRSGVQR